MVEAAMGIMDAFERERTLFDFFVRPQIDPGSQEITIASRIYTNASYSGRRVSDE